MSTTVVEFENQDVIVVEMSGRGPIGPRGRQGEPGPAGPSEWGVIQGNISDQSDLQNALDAKADAGASYTKSEEDALLAQKADVDSVYTKTETDSLLADKADADSVYTKTEVNTLLSGKADADTVYTKTETDTLLGAKADVGDSYTKTEEDALLAVKANSADVYTKTETDTLLADKADSDDVYTKDETDALLADKAPVILSNASGSIASFSDGSASPVTALSVGIEPVQSGTGDPSPENVRPISGHSTATVTRTGKNLCPIAEISDSYNGVQITTNQDGSISAVGTPTSNFYVALYGGFYNKRIPVPKWLEVGKTYYIASGITGSDQYKHIEVDFYDEAGNGTVFYDSSFTVLDTYKYIGIFIRIRTGAGAINLTFHPQLELGSTASAYEPYQGTSVTIDLDGTRYGGELNVLTGEMTLLWKSVTITGEDYIGNVSSSSSIRIAMALPEDSMTWSSTTALSNKIICSGFKESTNELTNAGAVGLHYRANGSHNVVFSFGNSFPGVSTVDNAIAWINSNPQQVVYYLATPLTVTLSPSQMQTLLGQNNIWADTGDVAVEYRADTKLYIDGVASATAKVTRQMIADSATVDGKAPKSLATGDLIIVGEELRKATSNIGNGSAITASNSTTATLADVIKALQ